MPPTPWKSPRFVCRCRRLCLRSSALDCGRVASSSILLGVVCKDLGIKGMYKGSTITLLRDVPYSMIFFPLNATMQNWFMDEHGNIPLGGLLTAGMVAGCFAAGLMTPMDVIKTRVQAEKGNKLEVKFFDMFKKIFKTEGIKGLYKGAVPRMCVQAPLFSIACTAFELQKRYLAYGQFFPKY